MRLVTFEPAAGCERLGILIMEQVVDLALAGATYRLVTHHEIPSLASDMVSFLNQGEAVIDASEKVSEWAESVIAKNGEIVISSGEKISYSLGNVHIRAPILRPPKILCLALNYQAHGQEVKTTIPEKPYVFIKPGIRPVVGHNDKVLRPPKSQNFVYEGELAIVIGKCCKCVPRDKAYEVIAGYTLVNDMSARDLMKTATPGRTDWFQGKAFDTSLPMGPCLVLKDEIKDPHNLQLLVRVNGGTVQNASTGEMIHKVPEIVEFISDGITLDPGDIIATGTPAGSTVALKDGDQVEVEVPEIGILRSIIATRE